MNIKPIHIARYIKYIPAILRVNFKFGFYPSIKLPILPLIITSRLRLKRDSTSKIDATAGSYLRLGYGSGGISVYKNTGINLEFHKNSILKIRGISKVGYGSSICIYENAELIMHNNTYLAGNLTIKCAKKINIGNNCAISWNVTLIDSDFHPWSVNDVNREISETIIIEDHVWIGNNSIILKGVTIGEGSIVGAGSIVTKNVPKNCLVAGNPAKIIHQNVKW
ncbi:MAG: hypothetical protein ACD_46C00193G0005 [uncultured bacterium]|nr:MAG: hypothetical protein ACD_46C00193G0005 [uncultured bacterium]